MVIVNFGDIPEGKLVKPTISVQGPYGVNDNIRTGLHSFSHSLAPSHPLHEHLLHVLRSQIPSNKPLNYDCMLE